MLTCWHAPRNCVCSCTKTTLKNPWPGFQWSIPNKLQSLNAWPRCAPICWTTLYLRWCNGDAMAFDRSLKVPLQHWQQWKCLHRTYIRQSPGLQVLNLHSTWGLDMDQELMRLNVFSQDAEVWDTAKYRESLKTFSCLYMVIGRCRCQHRREVLHFALFRTGWAWNFIFQKEFRCNTIATQNLTVDVRLCCHCGMLNCVLHLFEWCDAWLL